MNDERKTKSQLRAELVQLLDTRDQLAAGALRLSHLRLSGDRFHHGAGNEGDKYVAGYLNLDSGAHRVGVLPIV